MEDFGRPHWELRHNEDPVTSHEAAEQARSAENERKVLEVIRERWEDGLDTIGDDVLEAVGIRDQREDPVSEGGYWARFAGLERNGYICLTGDIRKGHRFGRAQQCWRPMSEEERDAFLYRKSLLDRQEVEGQHLALLESWSIALQGLEHYRQEEERLRGLFLDRFLGDAPAGKYRFDLPHQHELQINLTSRGNSMKVAALTERQLRKRERERLEAAQEASINIATPE